MNRLTFQDLGLSPMLLKAVDKLGYQQPTPIQKQAIPVLIQGHDLLATAQTGTGKTASFTLPLLQNLLDYQVQVKDKKKRRPLNTRDPYRPQALVLAPTRELAIQIGESIQGYGQGTGLKHSVIFGGTPKSGQLQKLAWHPQILVATPGRLLDFIQEGMVDISRIYQLILDEADRMLDMGFIGDVKKIAGMTKEREQTMLFSATMPPAIEALGAFLLKNPQRVAIQPKEVAVDRIRQSVFHLDQSNKLKLLKQVILERSMYKVIVFTRTKHRAARVAKVLHKAGIPSDAIHGDRNQNQRQRALAGLKNGKVQALVATDVAARGIDVDDVTHVINFEIPHESESYVHRIGRTARAGTDGDALSFCNPEERDDLRAIEKLIGKSLPVDRDHEFHIEPPVQQTSTSKKKTQPKAKSNTQSKTKPNSQQKGKRNPRQNGKPNTQSKAKQNSQPKAQSNNQNTGRSKPKSKDPRQENKVPSGKTRGLAQQSIAEAIGSRSIVNPRRSRESGQRRRAS